MTLPVWAILLWGAAVFVACGLLAIYLAKKHGPMNDRLELALVFWFWWVVAIMWLVFTFPVWLYEWFDD